jgi:hypothetical protein
MLLFFSGLIAGLVLGLAAAVGLALWTLRED